MTGAGKRWWNIGWLWLGIPLIGNAAAGHIAGLTLRYEHLRGLQYKVVWYELIDCRQWNGQPATVSIWAGCRRDVASRGRGIRFSPRTPVGMEDVTPLCGKLHSACNSSTAGTGGYGITRLHTEFVLNMDTIQPASCCWARIYAYAFSRNIPPVVNLQGVGAGLYTYIDINLCDTPTGKGPVWQAPEIPFFCVGDTVAYDPLIEDPDGDSLIFRLARPLSASYSGRPAPVWYAADYSAHSPLKYAGYPHPDRPPPQGFHFDSTTGRFVFIPTEAMVAQIAFDVEEYRDGRLLSVTRVDYQFWILDCDNRRPHVSGVNGKDVTRVSVCEESTICFDVYSWDEDTADSLTMWMEGDVPGASFVTYPPSAGYQRRRMEGPKGRFCWTPMEGTARPFPYRFSIWVRDDACPAYGERRQVFEVQVKPLPFVLHGVDFLRCDYYRLWSRLMRGDSPVFQTWWVYGGNSTDSPQTFYDDTVWLAFDVGRLWYSYRMSVTANGCVRDYADSFFVPKFPRVWIVPSDTEGCVQDTLRFGAKVQDVHPAHRFDWSTGDSLDSAYVVPRVGGWVVVRLLDSVSGCVAYDTAVYRVRGMPLVEGRPVDDTFRICAGDSVLFSGYPTGGVWYLWDTLRLQDSLWFAFSDGVYTFRYHYVDSVGCANADTIQLRAVPAPAVSVERYPPFACDAAVFELSGDVRDAAAVRWRSDGSGVFHDPTASTVQYYPSNADRERGGVGLTLVGEGYPPCGPDSADVWVRLYQGPRALFSADARAGCAPLAVVLSDRSVAGDTAITSRAWHVDDTVVWNTPVYRHVFVRPGFYSGSLVVQDAHGCGDTLTYADYFRTYPVPKAAFRVEPETAVWPRRRFWFYNESESVGASSSLSVWNFGDPALPGGGWDTGWDGQHRYDDTGSFRVGLWVKNRWGCIDSAFRTVRIAPGLQVYAPNAFSPDGKGPAVNERFRVSASGFTDFRLLIYDRWGQVIYRSNDYASHGWDGGVGGRAAPADVYMWQVVLTDPAGGRHRVSGMVQLVR